MTSSLYSLQIWVCNALSCVGSVLALPGLPREEGIILGWVLTQKSAWIISCDSETVSNLGRARPDSPWVGCRRSGGGQKRFQKPCTTWSMTVLAGRRLPLIHPGPGGRGALVASGSLYSPRAQRGCPTAVHTRQLEPVFWNVFIF